MNSCMMNISEDGIREMFKHYVASMEGRPRHTAEADHEVGLFSAYCSDAFGTDIKVQNSLYERMMCCAVEFEESGFIAGFRWAAKLMSEWQDAGNAHAVDEHARNKNLVASEKSSAGTKLKDVEPVKNRKPEQRKHLIDVEQKGCITSKQIAEMFGTTNWKVVRRIEQIIFPYLDEGSKKFFEKTEYFTVQHKAVAIYKLNRAASMIYFKEVERRKNSHTAVAAGCAKMQELMEKVFPTEKVMNPAS